MKLLLVDSRGSNFVEYLIVVGVVALTCVGAFAALGDSLTRKLARQGDSVVAMESRGSQNPPSSAPAPVRGAAAPLDLAPEGKASSGWAAAIENPRSDSAVRDSDDGWSSPAMVLFAAIGVAGGVAGVWFWRKKNSAGDPWASFAATLAQMIAPATKYGAALRSQWAGRLPWTPRE